MGRYSNAYVHERHREINNLQAEVKKLQEGIKQLFAMCYGFPNDKGPLDTAMDLLKKDKSEDSTHQSQSIVNMREMYEKTIEEKNQIINELKKKCCDRMGECTYTDGSR